MDEYTADAFANRDEPVPLLTVTQSDVDTSSSDADKVSKARRLRTSLSPSRLKERAQEIGVAHIRAGSESGASIQDRLFAKLLESVIPSQDLGDGTEDVVDRRSSIYVQRPAFSLPLMTANFRRFNARIGIVFVFQNRMIRLFTWRKPTHTLSFLSVYTFVCLDPHLLVALPLVTALLFIMVPAFITRHPPPPPSTSTSSITPYYSYDGPALAPPRTIRPASETSKDFFRNMRDLQNSMADFAMLHDALISLVAPWTNFSNEILSSTLFLYLTVVTAMLFISAQLLPWRFVFLLVGYSATVSGHPAVQLWLAKTQKRVEHDLEELQKRQEPVTSPSSLPTVLGVPIPATVLRGWALAQSLSVMSLDSAPETREVEVFELHHRPLLSSSLSSTLSSSPSAATIGPDSTAAAAAAAAQLEKEWTHHMYTPTPYDPLSPARISGSRPVGTRFFEDVRPPAGWAWEGKKWELDLEPGEWVSERLITGVEYDVSVAGGGDVSGGSWVWDLPPLQPPREEEVWLAYGDYDLSSPGGAAGKSDKTKAGKGKEKEKDLKKMPPPNRDWEESTIWAGRTGEWRRRRWVRIVKRVGVGG